MRIALASPRVAPTVDACLEKVSACVSEAASRGADIVCFPEAYLPGLRGLDFDVPPFGPALQAEVLEAVADRARAHRIAVVLGLEWHTDAGRHIGSAVIDADGRLQGCQTKNQLDPTEEPHYVPGRGRQLFEVNGVKFGVAICHEGFRYPETVRWAAVRGAKLVFHPHCTGSDFTGSAPTQWLDPNGPYYEKAMMCRALENTVFFAGVNYAFRHPESATCVISPTGELVDRLPYGEEDLLVCDLDLSQATGLLASRYAPDRSAEVPR